MSHFRNRVAKAGFLAGVVTVAVSVMTAQSAFAFGTVGTATLENSGGVALTFPQGSNTNFLIGLSPTSGSAAPSCTGSTTGNQTEVQTYIVPVATAPGTLTYTGGTINGAGNFSLFDSTNAQVGPINTAAPVGGKGQVINIPSNIVFGGNFTTTTLTPGGASTQFNVGIACTVPATGGGAATVSDYWNTVCTFSPSTTDANGYTFSCAASTSVPESSLAVALPLGGAAIIGAGIYVNHRRRRPGIQQVAA